MKFKLTESQPNVFPMGDNICAEDTPLFIRISNKAFKSYGCIDIRPIGELLDESKIEIDALGREYDKSKKYYQVLCRSGWCDVKYIYRHKTDKPIYEVSDGNMRVEVTEDHSLFNDKQEKIIDRVILDCGLTDKIIRLMAKTLKNGICKRVPFEIINSTKENICLFLETLGDDFKPSNKTCLATIQYLKTVIR